MVMLLLLQQPGGATAEEQQQHEEQQQEHHPIIQELVVHTHLDNDEAQWWHQQQHPWLTMTMSLHQRITQLPTKLGLVLETSSVVGLHSAICECR